MTQTPPKQPQQLEIPLFVNVNAKQELALSQSSFIKVATSIRHSQDNSSLEATETDLSIYQSISDNFFRKYK